MGHSSLAVSLTYLRGLEVSELEEEDMPIISILQSHISVSPLVRNNQSLYRL